MAAVHCLDPAYPMARPGHFRFLLAGLRELEQDLAGLNIPSVQLLGHPPLEMARLAQDLDAAAVVSDFDPLRHKRRWLAQAAQDLTCPLHEVDARNVVPCFVASDKAEYAARTIRPRIHRLLPEFLEDFPALNVQPSWTGQPVGRSWEEVEQALPGLAQAPAPLSFAPGARAGLAALAAFTDQGLAGYAARRNDPSLAGQSGLSPWLHFGMLSAQRAALAAAQAQAPAEDKEAFLEELVVRRELADNFCLHRQDYDRPTCFPDWARRTLDKHAGDARPYLYSPEQLEAGSTHDPAWNAAQRQLARTGKMHGYMRMYWCKKILEWSPDPGEAQARALRLNDSLGLDGRDPNGYAGRGLEHRRGPRQALGRTAGVRDDTVHEFHGLEAQVQRGGVRQGGGPGGLRPAPHMPRLRLASSQCPTTKPQMMPTTQEKMHMMPKKPMRALISPMVRLPKRMW